MDLLTKFETHLNYTFPRTNSFHPHFDIAVEKMLNAGGKRFRPMLLLSVVSSKEPLLIDNALDVALALEYLHTYSLIHDDLPAMDNAPLRRGITTLHVEYDEATAILVGDGLNTHAFSLIANAPLDNDTKIECIKVLSYDGGIGGMVIGQAIDLFFENKPLDIEKLKYLHIHKTAKLIAGSLKMGAIIADYPLETQNKIYDFGIELGLLFQMQDDIIDEIEDEATAGKTTNNDEGKNSFTNLLGLDEAINQTDALANKLQQEFSTFDERIQNSLSSLMQKYLFRHRKD